MCMNLLYRILHVNRDQIWPHRNFVIRWDWVRRSLFIILILLAVLYCINLARDWSANRHRAEQITRAITDIEHRNRPPLALSIPSDGLPMPPPPKEPLKEQPDTSSIEIHALGNELKLVNEASWSMIIKFCFTWAFILATVLAYRIIDRKYA